MVLTMILRTRDSLVSSQIMMFPCIYLYSHRKITSQSQLTVKENTLRMSAMFSVSSQTAQSTTFLPCVVKLTARVCFRCEGRRQQLPEPVGVHQ